MPVARPDYQLSFDLDLPEDDSDKSHLSIEEIRLRSETARQALEGRALPWLEEYQRLRNGGWPWRVAAYIAWASMPKEGRNPKSQEELALTPQFIQVDRLGPVYEMPPHPYNP